MIHQDPRDPAPEIVDDPKKSQDHDREIQTDQDDQKEDYQYTDWASI